MQAEMLSQDAAPESIVYLNGEYMCSADAKISVFDHVVLYGDAVFDTMCAWNHMIFKLDAHLTRLYESAHAVMLRIPMAKAQLKDTVLETVRRTGLRNAYVKVIVTRGVGAQPLLSPYNCTPAVIVFAVPYLSLAGHDGDIRGIKVIVSSMRRIPNQCISTRIKSCNYLNHVLMRLEANEAGANDAIELDLEGYVCEAPGYNVFVVKQGVLSTPVDNVLMGITRETVVELAQAANIVVQEGRVQVFDLYNADEVFLSSTAGGIVPVVSLDGRMIGDGKPGPLTQAFQRQYLDLLESGRHSTPVGAVVKSSGRTLAT